MREQEPTVEPRFKSLYPLARHFVLIVSLETVQVPPRFAHCWSPRPVALPRHRFDGQSLSLRRLQNALEERL